MWEAQDRNFCLFSRGGVFSHSSPPLPSPNLPHNSLDVWFFCIEANKVPIGCLTSSASHKEWSSANCLVGMMNSDDL